MTHQHALCVTTDLEFSDFHSSSSLSNALDAALDVCNLSKDDIDVFDFYS
jgi:hypothetical protein